MKSTVHTPEEFDRRYGSESTRPVPTDNAISALAANAGGDFLDFTQPDLPEYLTVDDTEVQGCQLIDAANLLMEYRECPADLRHLVLAVCGLSGGRFDDFTPITQIKIGKRMGVTREEVYRRTEALWRWQREHAVTFIQIKQQELDKSGGSVKFGTTLYKPVIVPYAAEVIRVLSARGMRGVNRQDALNPATVRAITQTVDEVSARMPYAEMERRSSTQPREKNVTPQPARQRFLDEGEQSARRGVERWLSSIKQSGYTPDPEELLNTVRGWLHELLEGQR